MIKIGEQFIIHGTKRISFRKEDGFYVSFDPVIFEIIKINDFAGEVLFYISLGMNFSSIEKIITLKYKVDNEIFSKDIKGFFYSYPSIGCIKSLIIDLGFNI